MALVSRIDTRSVTIDLGASPVHRPNGSPFAEPAPAPLETYRVGDRVSHDTWGLGRVVDLAEDRSLLVTFGGARTLRVTIPYRKLQKL